MNEQTDLDTPTLQSGLPPIVLTIDEREHVYVRIFGRVYPLQRPDEGLQADQIRARNIGTRLALVGSKKNLTNADQDNLARDSRELVSILVPHLEEGTLKMLRISELAAISSAWRSAYGEDRE